MFFATAYHDDCRCLRGNLRFREKVRAAYLLVAWAKSRPPLCSAMAPCPLRGRRRFEGGAADPLTSMNVSDNVLVWIRWRTAALGCTWAARPPTSVVAT